MASSTLPQSAQTAKVQSQSFTEEGSLWTYTHNNTSFSINPAQGYWSLHLPQANLHIHQATWEADIYNHIYYSPTLNWEPTVNGDGVTLIAKADGFTFTYTINVSEITAYGSTFPSFSFALGITGNHEPGVNKLSPVVLNPKNLSGNFFQANTKYLTFTHSMGGANVLDFTELPESYQDDRVKGLSQMTAIGNQSQSHSLFFGFQSPLDYPSRFVYQQGREYRPSFEAFSDCEVDLSNNTIQSETLHLYVAPSVNTALETYGDLISDKRTYTSVNGWNSWDSYKETISEEEILKNVEAIKNSKTLTENYDYICIDEGWHHFLGDWEANYRFPNGMEHVAKKIKEAGFKPGLWFSPMVMTIDSALYFNNFDFAAQNEWDFPDEVMGPKKRGYTLDIANPKVQKWLYDLFARYASYGYELFKLDFLRFEMYAKRHGGKRRPRAKMMRKALQIIRDAVGPDVHLVGCNMPSEVGAGIVDSNRITSDIRPYWITHKHNAPSMSAKYWMHGRLWANDPDFVVIRGHETYNTTQTCRSPWSTPQGFPDWMDFYGAWKDPKGKTNIKEGQILLSLIQLSGGNVFGSDRVYELNEAGYDLYERCSKATNIAGQPLDLLESKGRATAWVQQLEDEKRFALINWEDEAKTFDAAAVFADHGLAEGDKLIDFWTDQEVTVSKDLTLDPHSCVYWIKR